MKIFGIVGWKNTGKTTLMEKIISSLVSRGYTISSIKHAHHNFEIDKKGKDSYRHRTAGASQVIISSQTSWALLSQQNIPKQGSLEKLLKKLDPVDFVLVEGFKVGSHPKIECYRTGTPNKPLIKSDSNIKGLVHNLENHDPSKHEFKFEDIEGITNFIIKNSISIK